MPGIGRATHGRPRCGPSWHRERARGRVTAPAADPEVSAGVLLRAERVRGRRWRTDLIQLRGARRSAARRGNQRTAHGRRHSAAAGRGRTCSKSALCISPDGLACDPAAVTSEPGGTRGIAQVSTARRPADKLRGNSSATARSQKQPSLGMLLCNATMDKSLSPGGPYSIERLCARFSRTRLPPSAA